MSAGRLTGVRVLVPRPRERAQELCFLLEDEGAEVVAAPVLELSPPSDPSGLRAAAEQLQRYAWIAFASPSAVEALAEAAREAKTVDRLRRAKVAVVGPRTADAARALGLTVALEAGAATGAGLAQALLPRLAPGEEVLLPAAEQGRRELEDALSEAGAGVTRVNAYRAVETPLPDELKASLAAAPPDVTVFTSPRAAGALLDAVGPAGRAWLERGKRVAIGPTTASALVEAGLPAAAVAERPTSEALVEAVFQAIRG